MHPHILPPPMMVSLVNSARNSFSSTSSSSTIPSKSSHTSIFLLSPPSSKPDENSLPTSAPSESMNGSPRRWSPHTSSNKRKRDSELRSLNDLQLREAQEKVEQKRARIAARVPAPNSRPASAPVTSLADLYAQMRRDSGASGQQPRSSVAPSTNAVHENGRILDSRAQNAPRGHNHTTSSPDPIALCEDDQEIVMLEHIPGSSRGRASFESEVVLAPSTHSQSSSKDKSKTSTSKSVTANGVPKLSFAVVVPSPSKLSTHKPTRVERERLEPDSSRLRYHTSDEYGMKRSRRGMGLSEDLTARDLDILLGAVPVPFDFSLARRHLASREKDGNEEKSEESLWWYHPIFEARAKADIRRTLRAFLPSDPAQDPPFPIGGAGGRKAEVRPRVSRARIWADRLEDAFGPGPLDRGLGRKPRRGARPAGAEKRERFQNGAGGVVVIPNSHRSTPRILEPPSRRRSPRDAAADEAFFDSLGADIGDVAVVDAGAGAGAGINGSESEAAAAWTAALLPLVKGKIMLDKTKMAQISDALGEVELANKEPSFAREVLKESALGDTVRRLGELDSVPLGDVYRLRVRARTLAEQWREAFGDEVVDLQREVLSHVS